MLDAAFYATALPDLVRQACAARPGCIPLVRLHLGDGTALDLCEVLRIAPNWVALSYHRDKTCTGTDLVCVPYGAVGRVTVSNHPSGRRPLGFGHRGSSDTKNELDSAVTT